MTDVGIQLLTFTTAPVDDDNDPGLLLLSGFDVLFMRVPMFCSVFAEDIQV